MDGPIKLHAERDILERRLLLLEQVLQEQQRQGVAAPELVKREADLLAQLGLVNAKLAVMYGFVVPGQTDALEAHSEPVARFSDVG